MKRIMFAMALASAAPVFAAQPAPADSGIVLGERPIARTEVVAFVRKQFATMDSNHDGYVSPGEFQAFLAREDVNVPQGIGHIGRRWFEKSDTDGDGRVSIEEALSRPLQMFDIADLDSNGVASVEEQSMAQMLLGK